MAGLQNLQLGKICDVVIGPMTVQPGTNAPTTIGGRDYLSHALDQMQSRGVTPSAVENAVQNGQVSPGNTPGTTVHIFSDGVAAVHPGSLFVTA